MFGVKQAKSMQQMVGTDVSEDVWKTLHSFLGTEERICILVKLSNF